MGNATLIADAQDELQRLPQDFRVQAENVNIKINDTKIKAMIIARKPRMYTKSYQAHNRASNRLYLLIWS